MEFNKNRWYVQWFFLSLRVIDNFGGRSGDNTYYYRHGTNLCHFMRVTLLWAPLVVALHIALYGLAVAALVLTPLHYFGLIGAAKIYGVILLGVGALILVVAGIWGATELAVFVDRKVSETSATMKERQKLAAARKAERGPSFGSVLWQYVIAIKRRICPIITFKQTQA